MCYANYIWAKYYHFGTIKTYFKEGRIEQADWVQSNKFTSVGTWPYSLKFSTVLFLLKFQANKTVSELLSVLKQKYNTKHDNKNVLYIKYSTYLSKANTVSLFKSLVPKETDSTSTIERSSFKVLSVKVIFGIVLFLKIAGSELMTGVPGNNDPRILNASNVSFFQLLGLSVHTH